MDLRVETAFHRDECDATLHFAGLGSEDEERSVWALLTVPWGGQCVHWTWWKLAERGVIDAAVIVGTMALDLKWINLRSMSTGLCSHLRHSTIGHRDRVTTERIF
jgi:hypothetical protein